MGKTTKRSAGEQLKAWRTSAGLSQFEAGELIGVKQPTWCEWENDTALPRVEHALALAKATGLSIEIFVPSKTRTGTNG